MTQFVFNLFILSPARFCFSRGSRVTCGSFGFLSNRVYTTVNLTPLNKDNQIKQSISNRPENLALDHINSGNTTTATVINNILPITKDTQASFTAVVGKSVHSGGFAGGIRFYTHSFKF